MRFSERLRDLRKRSGLSQKALAEAVDTSVTNISRIENGQQDPRLGLLIALADHFDVPIDSLIGRDTGEAEIPPSLLKLYRHAAEAGLTPVMLSDFFQWLINEKKKGALEERSKNLAADLDGLVPGLTSEELVERLKKYRKEVIRDLINMPDKALEDFQKDLHKLFVYYGLETRKGRRATKQTGGGPKKQPGRKKPS